MKKPVIYLIDDWAYLLVGKCTGLRICREEDIASATYDELAVMVVFALATDSYHTIQSSVGRTVH